MKIGPDKIKCKYCECNIDTLRKLKGFGLKYKSHLSEIAYTNLWEVIYISNIGDIIGSTNLHPKFLNADHVKEIELINNEFYLVEKEEI